MMHVIVAERLYDGEFVARHTVGVEALAAHLRDYPVTWAARVTGLAPERITALARRYATTRPAMILLGGSSMHTGAMPECNRFAVLTGGTRGGAGSRWSPRRYGGRLTRPTGTLPSGTEFSTGLPKTCRNDSHSGTADQRRYTRIPGDGMAE